ncbi:hypothetical protein EGW08_019437 [Elysia chlorotica]|uniref:RNase H type-1 domain-containing protein n=1 Tax=Elysia chlorotica TaxID=188477 RepID=A0A433SU49_ELYCH|nr:hypothetical protein EGW08_019437 [Elysia chlorotica]
MARWVFPRGGKSEKGPAGRVGLGRFVSVSVETKAKGGNKVEVAPSLQIDDIKLRGKKGELKDLAALQEDKTPPKLYREIFEQIIENHSDHHLLFTDGSKDETCIRVPLILSRYCCGVSADFNIHMCMALNTVSTSRKETFFILSDSLSLVKASEEANLKNPNLLRKIHELQQNRKKITLSWTPSHIGIEGNEMADQLTKIGLKLQPTRVQIPASDAKPIIHKFIRELEGAME